MGGPILSPWVAAWIYGEVSESPYIFLSVPELQTRFLSQRGEWLRWLHSHGSDARAHTAALARRYIEFWNHHRGAFIEEIGPRDIPDPRTVLLAVARHLLSAQFPNQIPLVSLQVYWTSLRICSGLLTAVGKIQTASTLFKNLSRLGSQWSYFYSLPSTISTTSLRSTVGPAETKADNGDNLPITDSESPRTKSTSFQLPSNLIALCTVLVCPGSYEPHVLTDCFAFAMGRPLTKLIQEGCESNQLPPSSFVKLRGYLSKDIISFLCDHGLHHWSMHTDENQESLITKVGRIELHRIKSVWNVPPGNIRPILICNQENENWSGLQSGKCPKRLEGMFNDEVTQNFYLLHFIFELVFDW
jgi:hypothetical protein